MPYEDEDKHTRAVSAFVYVEQATQYKIRHIQPCLLTHLSSRCREHIFTTFHVTANPVVHPRKEVRLR
jgi:hypothetical protein